MKVEDIENIKSKLKTNPKKTICILLVLGIFSLLYIYFGSYVSEKGKQLAGIDNTFKNNSVLPDKSTNNKGLNQAQANLTITLSPLSATFNVFEDKEIEVKKSKILGLDQYSLAIHNKGKVITQNIDLRCQFPMPVVKYKIINHPLSGNISFNPADGGEWNVYGSGNIQIKGKIVTPYYQLKIEKLHPNDTVELRVDLSAMNNSSTQPFKGMPNLPKEKLNFIAGTFKQKVGSDLKEQEIYYSLNTDKNGSLSLGSKAIKRPKGLLYGIGFE